MQYLGGKAGPGARIAQLCSERLGDNALFVDMFCGSLNVVRHIETPRRLAVDACGPLIVMWRAALRGWVPPTEVSREEYDGVKVTQDPNDPLTAFVLFGCSFGGKWCGGYAKNRPTQRYAEHASHQVVAKASDCIGTVLEHADFQEKCPGCWSPGTVLYCDPPYAGTTGYTALKRFDSGAFWDWAGEHAQRGVNVFVSEYSAPDSWQLVDEQVATQAGRLTPGSKEKRVDRLFYRGVM
jgi:DNA adenine methylase